MMPSKSACCNCSNQCLQFENLTSDHGLMIALNIPDNTTTSNTTSTTQCTCLKLHPEVDANLAQFHPNIYIPSSLLNYPDKLVKYGGGGMFMHILCTYLIVLRDLTVIYTLHLFAIRVGSDSLWRVSSTSRITSNETWRK